MQQPWTPDPHLWPSLGRPEPPAPLATKVDRWLWSSIALSTSVPSLAAYGRSWPAPPASQPSPPAESKPYSTGTARAFMLALTAISLLYAAILLILSHRERALARPRIPTHGAEYSESTRYTTARLRQTLSLLMAAVGQSFLAALCLYVGVRATFLLRNGSRAPPFGRAYADLGLVVVQLGLMSYVILCCVAHEGKMQTYLFLEEEREAENIAMFAGDDMLDEE